MTQSVYIVFTFGIITGIFLTIIYARSRDRYFVKLIGTICMNIWERVTREFGEKEVAEVIDYSRNHVVVK